MWWNLVLIKGPDSLLEPVLVERSEKRGDPHPGPDASTALQLWCHEWGPPRLPGASFSWCGSEEGWRGIDGVVLVERGRTNGVERDGKSAEELGPPFLVSQIWVELFPNSDIWFHELTWDLIPLLPHRGDSAGTVHTVFRTGAMFVLALPWFHSSHSIYNQIVSQNNLKVLYF